MRTEPMQESGIFHKLLALQEEVYQTAMDKGFWQAGQNRNQGETIMLIITELAEAVEAHRKGKIFIHSDRTVAYLDGSAVSDNPGLSPLSVFQAQVKDTYQDEIADAVIRILDFTAGYGYKLLERECRAVSRCNFADDVLKITRCVLIAGQQFQTQTRDWGDVLAYIILFCDWYQIDLVQHVTWKMQYNKTRAFLHGKAY